MTGEEYSELFPSMADKDEKKRDLERRVIQASLKAKQARIEEARNSVRDRHIAMRNSHCLRQTLEHLEKMVQDTRPVGYPSLWPITDSMREKIDLHIKIMKSMKDEDLDNLNPLTKERIGEIAGTSGIALEKVEELIKMHEISRKL